MAEQVTIETASRAEAELIAALLPARARAESWRGFGVIRLGPRGRAEVAAVMEAVAEGVHRHGLEWTRVRHGDDERIFRSNSSR